MNRSSSKFGAFFFICLFSTAVLSAGTKMTVDQAKDARQKLIVQARTYIGTPYVSGGTTASGMDCSGLIYTVVRETLNMPFARTVAQQYSECAIIKDTEKEAGDLVFFKTVGDRISHVGLYVGNSQFIHAASDGPNTGVIMSSLNESYWKQHYYCAGRFLPSGQKPNSTVSTVTVPDQSSSTSISSFSLADILHNTDFDISVAMPTSMFTRSDIMLTVRGIDASVTASYGNNQVRPGVSTGFRYDTKTHLFQIPVTATITTSNYLRLYIGPVISIGTAVIPGTTDSCKPSFFPGIIGLSWQTPSFTDNYPGVHLTADASYIVYNNTSGAALSPLDSIITGFTFAVGVRVTLPRF